MKQPSLALIGAGNLGFHLGQALKKAGLVIDQVYSRSLEKAKELATIVEAEAVDDLDQIDTETTQLYILAVPDDAITEVAKQLSERIKDKKHLPCVVHTSGATSSTVLADYFKDYGVFYPLQTFSRTKEVEFLTIPICVHASSESLEDALHFIASRISNKVYRINDEQRSTLHVAAVFANNFSNHLFSISKSILEEKDVPFDLLKPLILETALKVQEIEPKAAQTGPAIRGDVKTIARHIQQLEEHPDWKDLYLRLSKAINPSLKTK